MIAMPYRILIADDDPATTELLILLLRSYGFEAQATQSGAEAVRLLTDEPFDAAILDLMMPGMDGQQVCRTVRAFSNVPILMYSAVQDPRRIAEALDAGADDYLIKPTTGEVLAAHLRTLIRRVTGTLRPVPPPEADAPALTVQPG